MCDAKHGQIVVHRLKIEASGRDGKAALVKGRVLEPMGRNMEKRQ
jgi:hypothetical protein